MKYITSASSQLIFAWQTEVMIASLLDNGFTEEDINVSVTMVHNGVSKPWQQLQHKHPKARFCYFTANPELKYIGSTKAYGIWKYFEAYPEEVVHQYFFGDQDIVLSKPLPEFEKGIIHMSKTDYLDVNRITEKGDKYLPLMLNHMNIPQSVIKPTEGGGAQYVFDNIPVSIWKESYDKAVSMYHLIQDINIKDGKDDITGLNSWTAEMWTTLWCFWKHGYQTEIPESLTFNWPNFSIDLWDVNGIYHDAGNTRKLASDIGKELFCKYEWINRIPYGEEIPVSEDLCQYNYMKLVHEVGETSCLTDKHHVIYSEETNEALVKTTATGYEVAWIPNPTYHKVFDALKSRRLEDYAGKDTFMPMETYFWDIPYELKMEVQEELRGMAETFCGRSLEPTAVYGVREYTKGSFLKNHVDRQDTHHIGIVLLVDFDKQWPLMLKNHQGEWKSINILKNQVVLYESGICEHGRPIPFEGESYKALFIHYKYAD